MSQDTRKDKRAKVVSLNVRYKSATVDEFIENHSHDVSKGGLFVKTPTPFPPGTLLKFEIRLAGDKSVISGVGRVVWKREPTQAGTEKPAGMGVKFIKIDDSSRAVIDRLIAQKADAGSAYNSEQFVDEAVPVGHPSTLRGLVAAPAVEPGLPPGPSPVTAPPPAAGGTSKLPVPPPPTAAAPPLAAPPPPAAKNPALAGTLAGPRPSGLPAVPPPAPSSKPALGGAAKPPPPRPAGPPGPPGPPAPIATKPATAVGVGPASNRSPAPAATISAAAVPVEKPPSEPKLGAVRPPVPAPRKATMMGMPTPAPPKAEVPAAAPPPASATPAPAVARERTAEPMFPRLDPESGSEPARDQTVMKQAAELLEEALKEAGGSLDEIGQNPLFSQAGEAVQSGDTMIMSSPIPSGASPPSPLGDAHTHAARIEPASVIAASSPSQPLVFDAPASVSAPVVSASTRKVSDDLAAPKKKGGSAGPLVGLLLAALLVGGGVYAWQTGMLGGAIGPEKGPPSASTTAPPPPSSPPSAASVVPPVVATTDAATVAADAAATPAATTDAATSEVDAGKAATTTTTAVAPPPPAPPKPPRPPAPPKPPPPPPVEPTATTEPTPPPAPTPTPAPTPATPPTPTMEPWTPP